MRAGCRSSPLYLVMGGSREREVLKSERGGLINPRSLELAQYQFAQRVASFEVFKEQYQIQSQDNIPLLGPVHRRKVDGRSPISRSIGEEYELGR
jgi:hypothetical protein